MQSRYTYAVHASTSHSILVVSLWKVSPCLKTVWTLCMASMLSLCKNTRLVHVELQWNFYLLWHVTNLLVTCLNCWSSVTDFKRLLPVSLIHANFHHTWRCLKSDQIVSRVCAFSLCTESMCKCHIVVYFLIPFAYRLHESILFTNCKRNKFRKSHAAISSPRAENQSKLHFTDLTKAGTIAGHDIICPHIAATLVR